MKIKLNSDNELSLNKMIKIPSMIIVASAVFCKYKKYYLQVFLDSPFINYRPERNRTFLYFTYFLSITIALLIAVSIYFYMVKYKAKRKHLFPFYVRNNKLIVIYYKNGKEK